MQSLADMLFLQQPPYRHVLSSLAQEEGLNSDQLLALLQKEHALDLGTWKMRKVLVELEVRGMLVRVNNRFFLSEEWMNDLVQFVENYRESLNDPAFVQLVLEKISSKRVQQKI